MCSCPSTIQRLRLRCTHVGAVLFALISACHVGARARRTVSGQQRAETFRRGWIERRRYSVTCMHILLRSTCARAVPWSSPERGPARMAARSLSQLLHPHRLAPLARTRSRVRAPERIVCGAYARTASISLAPPRHGFYFQRTIHGYSGFITASIHHFLMKLHMESTSKLWLALSNPLLYLFHVRTCVYH
jgi:hypothetical protein